MNKQQRSTNQTPFACNLIGADLAERREETRVMLHEVEQVTELTDGYVYRFNGTDEWAPKLLEFALTERQCCPFFRFELVFEPDHGPIELRLRGPEGIKEFIRSELGDDHE